MIESSPQRLSRFLQRVIDALPAHVAVLDEGSKVVMVNEAWRAFARMNDYGDSDCGIGMEFKNVCPRTDGVRCAEVPSVAKGIRQVIAGERESFHLEYPCHSDDQKRFFQVRITRFREEEQWRVVVIHENITAARLAQEAVQESEERFRTMADTAPVLIWMSGLDKGCTYFNQQWLDFTGRTMEQELGDGWTEGVHPDDVDRHRAAYAAAFDGREEFCMEYRLRRHDGQYRWMLATATPRVNANGGFAGYIGSCVDTTDRKVLQQEIIDIANREQRRIGHDLHDGAGQELTGLGLMCETLLERLDGKRPASVALAAKISRGIDRVMVQVRSVAKGLVPVEVDAHGLRSALSDLATQTNELDGVRCDWRCDADVDVQDNDVATHLYRIAQEAVTNSLKHARARSDAPLHLEVSLRRDGRRIRLQILDDGVGIPGPAGANCGMGHRIMQYRAELIGAILNIRPSEGGGAEVTCILERPLS